MIGFQNLSKRAACYIKQSRSAVNADVINKYLMS